MKKSKRILALIMVVLFIFMMVFSMSGLIVSVHHSCIGLHCPVCERMAVVKDAVSIIKFLIFALFLAILISKSINMSPGRVKPNLCRYFTEIALKSRLNI